MTTEMSGRPKILVSSLMMAEDQERFRRDLLEFDLVFLTSGQFLFEREILDFFSGNGQIDGWISGDDEITETVLEEASPRLKAISKWGSGLDSIDLEAANKFGVVVTNSPGKLADAVAEVALGYSISLVRGLHQQNLQIRRGKWIKPQGSNLAACTVGIIGYGRVGGATGSLFKSFGSNVLFYDPLLLNSERSLGTLLKKSDIVLLCAPLTEHTSGIINSETLHLMKRGSFLVNVARGGLVVESDLIDALISGRLQGAALDVFEEEPLPSHSRLAQLDNVILGCHNANNTYEAKNSVHMQAVENLRKNLKLMN